PMQASSQSEGAAAVAPLRPSGLRDLPGLRESSIQSQKTLGDREVFFDEAILIALPLADAGCSGRERVRQGPDDPCGIGARRDSAGVMQLLDVPGVSLPGA